MSERTLKVTAPHHMRGDDVEAWQRVLNAQMRTWAVDYQIKVDGDYGVTTRDLAATVVFGLGYSTGLMAKGVTPELRVKVRNKRKTIAEKAAFAARAGWRSNLRDRHNAGGVAPPLAKIITHANGWSSWHDGVDLICARDAPGFAICRSKVVRADAGGWWGKGAPADPSVRAAGDGIVILQSLVSVGPIVKGMLICYGHAEHARVEVGDTVQAGDWICRAGMANAPHFHAMVNAGTARFWDGSRPLGIGDRDPWKILDYAIKHA